MIASRIAAALALAACGLATAAPRPAVCRIAVAERDGQAFGSGTLIDAREEYGLVVTNWHVVRDATGPIEVRFPSGFTSEARPLKLDETWDLAALVVWRPPTEPAPLAARPPQPGDRLTICGYGGGDYLEQTGRCTEYYSPEVGQPQEIVELSVEARQGDSGGPIFNSRGELAGVLFGAARGTTLGSFGGRVQTFLATLAPDIGAPRRKSTLIAQSPLSRGRKAADHESPSNSPGATDPFLAAERAAEPSRVGAIRGLPAAVESQRQVASVPAPSLADRSSAPSLAVARDQEAGWWSPPSATQAFTPQVSAAAPTNTEPIVDWYEDGRNLLALLGVAALVVAGVRSLS